MSGSLIYAAQQANGGRIPTFNFQTTGLVMRPEYSRVLCACDGDCGAKCVGAYGVTDPAPRYCDPVHPPRGWSACVWERGPPLGVLFERSKANHLYNEVVIDGSYWRAHLPGAIEAVLGDAAMHRSLIRAFGLSESRVPLLNLDLSNWQAPFS